MPHVIRWGQSPYETDVDVARERAGAEALGFTWNLWTSPGHPPDLGEAEVLYAPSTTKVRADAVEAFGGSLIHTTTSGFDHVDLGACAARGIAVGRMPEARRDAVVDYALAMMVLLMRRLPEQDALGSDGAWGRSRLPQIAPVGLTGATVLVIGHGVIGRKMTRVLDLLGATVLGVDPAGVPAPAIEVSLEEGLEAAHAVTVHCSLSASSRGMLGPSQLAQMNRDAVLVNTARGPVLDVDAAVQAVRSGALRGLACDVFPEEPWSRMAASAGLPNVWFSPHSAGVTDDLGARIADGVVEMLERFVDGQPPKHPVAI